MSLKVEIVSCEEAELWREMKSTLKEHNSYNGRQEFYPHNMDEWHKVNSMIESSYRKRILELNKKRKTDELNALKLEAVEGLLKLKNAKVPRSNLIKKSKKQNTIEVLRRSSRIAEMDKNM